MVGKVPEKAKENTKTTVKTAVATELVAGEEASERDQNLRW